MTWSSLLGIGLDLESWMREGLVDMLFLGGGYAHFSLPVAEMARAAHAHGVPVSILASTIPDN